MILFWLLLGKPYYVLICDFDDSQPIFSILLFPNVMYYYWPWFIGTIIIANDYQLLFVWYYYSCVWPRYLIPDQWLTNLWRPSIFDQWYLLILQWLVLFNWREGVMTFILLLFDDILMTSSSIWLLLLWPYNSNMTIIVTIDWLFSDQWPMMGPVTLLLFIVLLLCEGLR